MPNQIFRHGVARTRELIEAGMSKHQIGKAIRTGELRRIAHGWIAKPQADPVIVDAVQHRLTVSCTLQARRLGLWVREAKPLHFAVPRPGSEIRPAGAKLHYHRPLIPRERFEIVDRIENVLWLIAHCQPRDDAVAAWDAALHKELIDREFLSRLPLDGTARAVLDGTSLFMDSGLETYVRRRLRWLRIRIRWQIWLHGHRVDFLLADRLVLQVDGGDHVGAQREKDIAHDTELRLRGYTVIRVGYGQIMNHWADIQAQIMAAIAQGLHLVRADR